MADEIDRMMRRTRLYWFSDGLVEIALGCLFLLIGLLFTVEAGAPPGSQRSKISAYLLPVLLLVGIYGGGRVIKLIKERVTYRRTGFVSYRQPSRSRRMFTMAAAAVVSGALVALSVRFWPLALDSLVLQGLSVAFLIGIAGRGLPRFYAIGALSLMLGIVLSQIQAGAEYHNALLYGILGAAFLLSGAITLWRYLRQTRPVAEDPS